MTIIKIRFIYLSYLSYIFDNCTNRNNCNRIVREILRDRMDFEMDFSSFKCGMDDIYIYNAESLLIHVKLKF